jgi:hypothetical protein
MVHQTSSTLNKEPGVHVFLHYNHISLGLKDHDKYNQTESTTLPEIQQEIHSHLGSITCLSYGGWGKTFLWTGTKKPGVGYG